MQKEPVVKVGVLHAQRIVVELHSQFVSADGEAVGGRLEFVLAPGNKITWNGHLCDSVTLTAPGFSGTFTVEDVVIGVNFHWQRNECQSFKGDLGVIVEDGALTLINTLPVEDYLMSVISSEMNANASEEFLKAHAVISRSWLLAQINKQHTGFMPLPEDTDDEIVQWFDRDDHTNFDVCADDHCQRYQGISRQTTATVAHVIAASRGQVLTDKTGNLCDARFSKCCGGAFEEFETCWEPKHYDYLVAGRDKATDADRIPDLRDENAAREWIMNRPDAFCNTTDASILSQVLNNYDRETTDFYRWTVEYSQDELRELIARRSGIDFGKILALEPLERGTSGRISRLRIKGQKRTLTIGKELLIRRWLSPSHLYSSAFVVDTSGDTDGVPAHFTIHGAGWGHGVGLCQIGAAVMGAKGYSYDNILLHYFKGARITTLYK